MENNIPQVKKPGRMYRTTVILLLVIIIVGFGITFGIHFLYTQSQNPNSRIGQAWIDLQTQDQGDTDADGLTDAEENTYHTNFWEADTDHDTFPDGQEVRTQHNPTGPGKLSDQKKLDITNLKL